MGNNQDLFTSVTNLFSNAELVIWGAVGFIIAFMLLKWLFKANTFSTAVIAIIAIALLSWLVGAVRGGTFDDQLQNTWDNSSSSSAGRQAPRG